MMMAMTTAVSQIGWEISRPSAIQAEKKNLGEAQA
jgi:hypothetical protein